MSNPLHHKGDNKPILLYFWLLADVQAQGDSAAILRTLARDYAEKSGIDVPCGFDGWPGAIVREEKGKPRFQDAADVFFSLSHSGDYGVCAFARQPLGLDLQIHSHRNREGIARRFFHLDEYDYLQRTGFAGFFSVWAAKESYVKYTGEGINSGFAHFSVAGAHGLQDRLEGVCFRHWVFGESDDSGFSAVAYSVSLCAPAIGAVCIVPYGMQKERMPILLSSETIETNGEAISGESAI